MFKRQTDPYTLQPGERFHQPDLKDPNFGKPDGHLDEITPTHSKDFNAQQYNTRNRNDVTIPAYSEKDRFPETKTTCNPGSVTYEDVRLPEGEYKVKHNTEVYVKDCITNEDIK